MVELSPAEPLLVGYIVVFGVAAVACFAGALKVRHVEDADTRRGLLALLVASGGWAVAHVGFLVVPGTALKLAFYQAGLIIGLSAVGAWLYFTSAYTGRTLHRNRTYRRVAVAVFLAIVALKVTNPIHQLYYTVEVVQTPYPHLVVQNGLVHWLTMGFSYALATVGYFMLFELFTQVSHDTRPLAVLVSLTGLPLLFDVVGLASPLFIDFTYEPLGVAIFAVGVGYVYLDRFQHVHLAGSQEDAVVFLDAAGRIRDYNREARTHFPALEGAIGEPFDRPMPAVAEALAADRSIVSIDRDGDTRYYRLTTNPFSASGDSMGSILVVTDVTDREQYRNELERQNERLAEFASMVSHDLRNPLNVATGRLDLLAEAGTSEDLETARDALDRMNALIEDVLAMARQGQPIGERETVRLATVAEVSWSMVETAAATLEVEGDMEFRADPDRLKQLLENLFRNAIEHGGEDVVVRVGPLDDDGFYVADDGPGIPPEKREDVFGSGYTTAAAGTGFGLAIVAEIVDAHGWSIAIGESEAGGARFEITGIESVESG